MARGARIAIAVMARAPSAPGKTRLAGHLSEPRLRALRVALLADTLRFVCGLSDVDRWIVFTPDEGREEISLLAAETAGMLRDRGPALEGLADPSSAPGRWNSPAAVA